jgi:hypothetical protein
MLTFPVVILISWIFFAIFSLQLCFTQGCIPKHLTKFNKGFLKGINVDLGEYLEFTVFETFHRK